MNELRCRQAHTVEILIAKRVMCAVYIFFAEPEQRNYVCAIPYVSSAAHTILTMPQNIYGVRLIECVCGTLMYNNCMCATIIIRHFILSIIFEFYRKGLVVFPRKVENIRVAAEKGREGAALTRMLPFKFFRHASRRERCSTYIFISRK